LMTPYGLVYIGDNFDELKSKPKEAYDRVEKVCVEYGLDMDKLGTDWLERTIFNACYVRDKMKTVVCKATTFNTVMRLF